MVFAGASGNDPQPCESDSRSEQGYFRCCPLSGALGEEMGEVPFEGTPSSEAAGRPPHALILAQRGGGQRPATAQTRQRVSVFSLRGVPGLHLQEAMGRSLGGGTDAQQEVPEARAVAPLAEPEMALASHSGAASSSGQRDQRRDPFGKTEVETAAGFLLKRPHQGMWLSSKAAEVALAAAKMSSMAGGMWAGRS